MVWNLKRRIIIFFVLLSLLGTSFAGVSSLQNDSSSNTPSESVFDGQILFAPYYSTTTYLIDASGTVNHTWPSTYRPFTEAYWLGDGSIMRPIESMSGGVQKILWDGTLAWDYRYTVSGCLCHHDIKVLPNGDVLMIVWVTKTRNEYIAAGRNPNTIPENTWRSERIIEVKPTGPTSGDVVWEWNVWDHLIQDYDPLKNNYGDVGDHPELIDINFGDYFENLDWLHANSLDYNATFDQILFDVHNFDEVWVIDHSTTIEEAAGHTGGRYGHGGDLLYRWGNPQAYRRGTSSDKKLFFEHDATWIPSGYPGAGDILIFNNGLNRPEGYYSTVDQFTPPVNSTGWYSLDSGSAYGPDDFSWEYIADPPTSFYSNVFGGALRLKNGNTLICQGIPGKFFEVTPDNSIVWEWTNPFPSLSQNWVFKIDYLPSGEPPQPPQNNTPDLQCEGTMNWTGIQPGATLHGSFQVENIGDPGSLLNWTVDSSPDWGTWAFAPGSGGNLTPGQGPVTIQVYVTAPDEKNMVYNGSIRVVNIDNPDDFCLIPVSLTTPLSQGLFTPLFQWLFSLLPHAFPLLRYLFWYA